MTSKPARADKKPREGRGCTPEMVEQIAAALESGKPLAVLCREDGMPGLRTVYDWMDKDPEVKKRLELAREAGEDVLAADCLSIADDSSTDYRQGPKGTIVETDSVARSKLRVWTRLQLLAKWNPKKYGDRQEIDHKSSDGSMATKPTVIKLVAGTGNE